MQSTTFDNISQKVPLGEVTSKSAHTHGIRATAYKVAVYEACRRRVFSGICIWIPGVFAFP